MRSPVLLLGLSMAMLVHAGPANPPDDATPRFAVQATLQATPAAMGDARFRLRGTLEPHVSQSALSGVGFVLKAALSPKTVPICYGPGHIFADGFETP